MSFSPIKCPIGELKYDLTYTWLSSSSSSIQFFLVPQLKLGVSWMFLQVPFPLLIKQTPWFLPFWYYHLQVVSSVILEKLLNFPMPQFLHLQNGDNSSICFIRLLSWLSEIIKHPEYASYVLIVSTLNVTCSYFNMTNCMPSGSLESGKATMVLPMHHIQLTIINTGGAFTSVI